MNNNSKKVTFGIINCNRLYYAKSCFYSLIQTTKSYENKEIIFIDNASVEEGTDQFLDKIKKQYNVKVFKISERDPANEFAKGLNKLCEEYTGNFLVPLQGDMQFILNDWLEYYLDFYTKNIDNIGCILLDAQRNKTNNEHQYSIPLTGSDHKFKFVYNYNRNAISGAGDVFYSRKIIDYIYPWSQNNQQHEGTLDSESAMLKKIKELSDVNTNKKLNCVMPIIPVSCAIYTDSRGTNARIRKNKLYGDYWPPKIDYRYYNISNLEDKIKLYATRVIPVGIEDIVEPLGFSLPLDENGNMKKQPIRPETASPEDYVVLYDETGQDEKGIHEWLTSV